MHRSSLSTSVERPEKSSPTKAVKALLYTGVVLIMIAATAVAVRILLSEKNQVSKNVSTNMKDQKLTGEKDSAQLLVMDKTSTVTGKNDPAGKDFDSDENDAELKSACENLIFVGNYPDVSVKEIEEALEDLSKIVGPEDFSEEAAVGPPLPISRVNFLAGKCGLSLEELNKVLVKGTHLGSFTTAELLKKYIAEECNRRINLVEEEDLKCDEVDLPELSPAEECLEELSQAVRIRCENKDIWCSYGIPTEEQKDECLQKYTNGSSKKQCRKRQREIYQVQRGQIDLLKENCAPGLAFDLELDQEKMHEAIAAECVIALNHGKEKFIDNETMPSWEVLAEYISYLERLADPEVKNLVFKKLQLFDEDFLGFSRYLNARNKFRLAYVDLLIQKLNGKYLYISGLENEVLTDDERQARQLIEQLGAARRNL